MISHIRTLVGVANPAYSQPPERDYLAVKNGVTTSYLIPLAMHPGRRDARPKYLVVDTGYPGGCDRFLERLQVHEAIAPDQLAYLLLTHHHDDHAGFAAALLERTGARLIVHERALPALARGVSEEPPEARYLNRRLRALFWLLDRFHAFTFPPVVPAPRDIVFRGSAPDRAVLARVGLRGFLVPTPGHTAGGLSLVLDDGAVFPGDNAMNAWYFNLLGSRKRPIYYTDFAAIRASWRRYAELGGRTVFPAHGKPFPLEALTRQS